MQHGPQPCKESLFISRLNLAFCLFAEAVAVATLSFSGANGGPMFVQLLLLPEGGDTSSSLQFHCFQGSRRFALG